MGAAYGILSNFNYVLTLGFVLGAAASIFLCYLGSLTLGRLNWTRNEDIITAIEVDQSQRLHITYLGKSGYDNIIVDKKNFVYNVLKPGAHGTKAIWCKINGEDFCISKANLQVNSQQFHHLLWLSNNIINIILYFVPSSWNFIMTWFSKQNFYSIWLNRFIDVFIYWSFL